jgi:hypothetical protein
MKPEIPVLMSRQAIALAQRRRAEPPTPLEPIGVTYSMAQETRWIDRDTFAIGRWDGTLTLFGPPAPGAGPRIESAAVSPAWAGLEMITPVDATSFATSNDERSIVLWDLSATGLAAPSATLRYDCAVGVANSGALVRGSAGPLLVTGHASGRLLIWEANATSPGFTLVRTLNLRSPDPVPSPYRLWNVRAVQAWRGEIVVTGAEDGDVCLVDVTAGRILCRRRYNPAARRGINDLAVLENVALVGGCSNGTDDSNTWAFALEAPSEIEPLAHVDLVADPSRAQVFNFSVELAPAGERILFFCATEEGLLWVGELRGGALEVPERLPVSSGLGAAVSLRPDGGTLPSVGDNVHLFRLRDLP